MKGFLISYTGISIGVLISHRTESSFKSGHLQRSIINTTRGEYVKNLDLAAAICNPLARLRWSMADIARLMVETARNGKKDIPGFSFLKHTSSEIEWQGIPRIFSKGNTLQELFYYSVPETKTRD